MNISELVGARILTTVKVGNYYNTQSLVDERRILELSPSGQWVRIMDTDGRKYWVRSAELQVVEVLSLTTEKRPVIK